MERTGIPKGKEGKRGERGGPVGSPLSFWNCMIMLVGRTLGAIFACLVGGPFASSLAIDSLF